MPLHHDRRLFELLILEGAQAGVGRVFQLCDAALEVSLWHDAQAKNMDQVRTNLLCNATADEDRYRAGRVAHHRAMAENARKLAATIAGGVR